MQKCPSCGSGRIHRSHVRSKFEHMKKWFVSTRPFRCHVCDWRGWGEQSTPPQDAPLAPSRPLDVAALDAATAALISNPRGEGR